MISHNKSDHHITDNCYQSVRLIYFLRFIVIIQHPERLIASLCGLTEQTSVRFLSSFIFFSRSFKHRNTKIKRVNRLVLFYLSPLTIQLFF